MNTFRTSVLIAAAGLLAAGSVPVAVASSGNPSLTGTWQYEMTVRFDAEDCANSEPVPFGPNPFPGLLSFHEGGTLSEYGSRSAPSIRSMGFGSWRQVSAYGYRARYTFMEFDPNGLLWRTMLIESKIRLGKYGNGYTAVNRMELTDISGNVTRICSTTEGQRFKP